MQTTVGFAGLWSVDTSANAAVSSSIIYDGLSAGAFDTTSSNPQNFTLNFDLSSDIGILLENVSIFISSGIVASDVQFSATLYSSPSDFSRVVVMGDQLDNSSIFLPFANLVSLSGGGADLNNIGAIRLGVTVSEDGVYSISSGSASIVPIPEPSSGFLVLLGGLALLRRHRQGMP